MSARPPARSISLLPALVLATALAEALGLVIARALSVLVASAEPAWRGFGLVLGCGAALGFTLATRAAPGLCALLRRGAGGGA